MGTEKSLVQNSLTYLAPKFAGVGMQLLTFPVLTRLLKPEDFGIAALAAVFPTLAIGVFSCGIGIAVQRFFFDYRKDPDALGRYIFTAQAFLHAALFASAVPVYLFRHALSRWLIGDAGHGDVVFVYYASTIFLTTMGVYLTILQNFENARMHSFVTLLQAGLSGALNVALCAAFRDYRGLMYAALISSFAVSAFCTIYFLPHFRWSFSAGMLKESLAYGAQGLPKSITSFFDRFVDKYLLNRAFALQAVGVYNIGLSLGHGMVSFMNAIWSSFQPVCYREAFDRGAEASGTVGRLFSHFLFATAFPLLLFLLFSPELIRLLAPPEYGAAVDVLAVVLCAMATQIFGMFVGLQYAYAKRPLYIFFSTTVGTAVNVGLNLLLIPRWGLLGAASALFLSYATTNGLLTAVGQTLYRIRYEWAFIACVYALVVASAAAGIWLRAQEAPYAGQLLFKLGALALLLLAGARWKVATAEKARKIAALFQRPRALAAFV